MIESEKQRVENSIFLKHSSNAVFHSLDNHHIMNFTKPEKRKLASHYWRISAHDQGKEVRM